MESVVLGVLVGVFTTLGMFFFDKDKYEYMDLFKIFLMTTISAVIVSYFLSFDFVKKLLIIGTGVGSMIKSKKITNILDDDSDADSVCSEFTAKPPDF